MKYDWMFCNYTENEIMEKIKINKKQQISHIEQLWNLLDAVVWFEGATPFAAGEVAGNACQRYSCCCVFCNCCAFAFVFRFCKPSAALIRSLTEFCCCCILPVLI